MKLRVVRVNQHCWVDQLYPFMVPVLTMHLVDSSPQRDENGNRITGVVKYDKPAYWVDNDGGVLFLSGLFDDFKKAAERSGYEVEYIDGRNPNPMSIKPQLEKLTADLRYKQADVLQQIMTQDKGIIKCSVGFGKSFIIKLICLLYPIARIVIITKARLVVDQIYKDIVQTLGKAEVGKLSAGTDTAEELKRVVVATNRSASRAPLDSCDFLLFDEVHNVGDNQIYELLRTTVGGARMFGFTASLERGDGALGLIKGLFGKVVAECTYEEAQQHHMVTPIRAIMPRYDHRPITKMTDMQVINKRIHYWQNWQRNQFIARIAADTPADAQTIITVETLEHAIFLHKQPELKDWPIIHAGDVEKGKEIITPYTLDTAPQTIECIRKSDESRCFLTIFPGDNTRVPGYVDGDRYVSFYDVMGLYVDDTGAPICHRYRKPVLVGGEDVSQFAMKKKQVTSLVESFAAGDIKKAIATTVIKEGINLHHLRVLIRADGASSPVFNTQVPGRLSRLQEGKDYTLLFDPWDDDNDWVRGRTMARMRLYRAQGWLK